MNLNIKSGSILMQSMTSVMSFAKTFYILLTFVRNMIKDIDTSNIGKIVHLKIIFSQQNTLNT